MAGSLKISNQKYQYIGFLPKSVRIKEKGFWGFNDFEGNQILPSNFIEAFTLSSGQGLVAARAAGYWDIYDYKGNLFLLRFIWNDKSKNWRELGTCE